MDISEEDQDQVELLVHISAPSKGTDDAAYRAFATAYLSFEPIRRYTRGEEPLDELEYSLPRHLEKHPPSISTTIERGQTNTPSSGDVQCLSSLRGATYSDGMNLSLKSPDASFKSVFDNLSSPMFYNAKQLANRRNTSYQKSFAEAADESSWQTVYDSQPLMTTSPSVTTSSINRLPANLDHKASPSPSTSGFLFPSSVNNFRRFMPTFSSGPLQNMAEQPQSSPELPALPRQRKRQRVDELEEDKDTSSDLQTSDPSPIIIPFSSPKPNSVASSEESSELSGPPQKRQRQFASAQNRTKPQVKSAEGNSSTVPAAVRPEQPLLARQVHIDPDVIRAPQPQTSLSTNLLDDVVTPTLAQLVEGGIDKSWREEFKSRTLRDTERGYWLVNYSTWEPELRQRSWEFLQGYVGKGLAGWGVWCVRSPEKNELRIFCWGMIVKHIYLLLRVVTERAVKHTGATWFDGGSEAVIVVPPKLTEHTEQSAPPG